MPKYRVLVKHTYEEDQFIEIEASDEEEANDKAGLEAYLGHKNDTWGNTDVTHVDMTVLEVEEITNA
tara:strand:- start:238 stop:438 length:201 start_codon:yes stop_codon:yes gene_type:complete